MTDSNNSIAPISISKDILEALALVAKMKDAADKHGIGFVGGFISPDGQKYIMSNMDDDSTRDLCPGGLK